MSIATAKTTNRKPRSHSAWSPERRARQSAMMRAARIWDKSTGPKTAEGKARSSQNAYKHGFASALERELSRLLRENNRMLRRVSTFVTLCKRFEKDGIPHDPDMLWQKMRDAGRTTQISQNELLNVVPFSATPMRHKKDDGTEILPSAEVIDEICKIGYNTRMDDETRKLLLAAWHENRLAALHVDAQWTFSDPVFPLIGTLAEGLRARAVRNIWVVWPDHERPIGTGITTVADYHRTNQTEDYYLSRHVGAQDDETVMMKNAQSAFGTAIPHLQNFLDAQNIDTFFVTGVGGRNACADKTIKSAILADKYNIVAITDCINKTGDDYRDHIRDITRKNPDAFERRYHEATSADVMNALRNAPAAP